MSGDTPFQMSQGLEVLPPKSGKAYPIPCAEWELLMTKLEKASGEPWFFHTIGSALLGMALSALLPLVTSTFQLPAQQRAHDLSWTVLVISAVCGAALLILAHKERGMHRERTGDVVAQMKLIEQRYERVS